MLQQDKPEDFVIATGQQYSVREFVDAAANQLGISIKWEGEGVKETGTVESISEDNISEHVFRDLEPGDTIVRVDPKYFRPTEVETLLGDPSKAKKELGWSPRITFEELVSEMVMEDLKSAERDELVKRHGFSAYDYHE